MPRRLAEAVQSICADCFHAVRAPVIKLCLIVQDQQAGYSREGSWMRNWKRLDQDGPFACIVVFSDFCCGLAKAFPVTSDRIASDSIVFLLWLAIFRCPWFAVARSFSITEAAAFEVVLPHLSVFCNFSEWELDEKADLMPIVRFPFSL
jgi:hypothetical protein